MDSRDRDILERAVHAIAEQAANTNKAIDEAMEAGLAADHPVTVTAKMLRLELLKTKAELANTLSHFAKRASPARRRVIDYLLRNPDCSQAEIAKALKLNPTTVKTTFRWIKDSLTQEQ